MRALFFKTVRKNRYSHYLMGQRSEIRTIVRFTSSPLSFLICKRAPEIFCLCVGGWVVVVKTDNMGLKAKYKIVVKQEGCPNFDFFKLSGVEFLDKNRGKKYY